MEEPKNLEPLAYRLTKIGEGHKIDKYDVTVMIDDVEVAAGTLYIARSLVEKRRMVIDLGPVSLKINDTWPISDESNESGTAPDDTATAE